MQNIKKLPYVYGLDVVRFICSLMVCIFHLTWHNPKTASMLPFGWIGVQIFFVISGVVIAGSSYNSTRMHFLKKRFLRLYPAAWIAAILNLAILIIMPLSVYDLAGISVHLTGRAVFQSLILFGYTFLASAYWTLPIEMAFYVLIFIFACGNGWNRLRLIARFLAVISATFLLLQTASYSSMFAIDPIDLGYGLKNVSLLRHGTFFSIGIYLWAIDNAQDFAKIDRALFGVSILSGLLEIYLRAMQVIGNYAQGTQENLHVNLLAFSAISTFVFFVAAIYYSLQNAYEWIPGRYGMKWLRTLGLITYPFYLIHEVLGGFFLNKLSWISENAHLNLLITTTLITMIAYLVARYGEPLLIKWLFHSRSKDLKFSSTAPPP
jgi:exopolysaccharide production protein ExoZ